MSFSNQIFLSNSDVYLFYKIYAPSPKPTHYNAEWLINNSKNEDSKK